MPSWWQGRSWLRRLRRRRRSDLQSWIRTLPPQLGQVDVMELARRLSISEGEKLPMLIAITALYRVLGEWHGRRGGGHGETAAPFYIAALVDLRRWFRWSTDQPTEARGWRRERARHRLTRQLGRALKQAQERGASEAACREASALVLGLFEDSP